MASDVGFSIMSTHPALYDPTSDIIATGGEYHRQAMERCGASEDRPFLTDWPKYDMYDDERAANGEGMKNILGGDPTSAL